MTQAPAASARTRAQIPGRTFRTDPWWLAAAYHRGATDDLPDLDEDLLAERQAHAARLDHPRNADADRPVHPARGQRGLLRSKNF